MSSWLFQWAVFMLIEHWFEHCAWKDEIFTIANFPHFSPFDIFFCWIMQRVINIYIVVWSKNDEVGIYKHYVNLYAEQTNKKQFYFNFNSEDIKHCWILNALAKKNPKKKGFHVSKYVCICISLRYLIKYRYLYQF